MTPTKISQIFFDKLKLYTDDPSKRCVDEDGACKYSGKSVGKNTPGCLIGQFFDEETRLLLDKLQVEGIGSLFSVEADDLKSIIHDTLGQFNKQMLVLMQALHDDDEYWGENGLSLSGKNHLKNTIHIYNLDRQVFESVL